ncbi:hypothetical protein ABT297_12220 [Dactylosporangium sp. NPDC000555]|uniref:hypothetical protein n=1 Tax=Dactylosporangium sp. NPDC000555 TaxID=3154260 RepID=UPI00332F82B3
MPLALLTALLTAIGGVYMFQHRGGAHTALEAAPVDLAVPDLPQSQLGQWCTDRQAMGTEGLSQHAREWLADCAGLFGEASTPPSAGSPSAKSPAASSPPPVRSQPPSPNATTPQAPPSRTGGPAQLGCMSKPSKCGWPDETNTGVPAGTSLRTHNGDYTISQAGTYTGLDVTGCLIIDADNVIVTRSRIGSGKNCGWYVVRSMNRRGAVLEDVEIILTGYDTKGIAFDGYTARRVWFHGGSDCAHAGGNVTIVDSFCDVAAGGPADGPHYDGFQSDGGHDITIKHNTIRVPYGQTSAILMSTNTAPIRDVSIVDNLVAGGGYTIYCGTTSGGPVGGRLAFSGNRVARTYFAKGGYWGPATSCPGGGAVWDDTGAAIG